MEYNYQHLLKDHQKLTKRVIEIEELLFEQGKDRNNLAKTLKNSRFKTASTQLLPKTHRRISTSKK